MSSPIEGPKNAQASRANPYRLGVLEDEIERVRAKINAHSYAGLHTLRHTFLTEGAENTDPFTLQYVAGHKNIKTTMRYVHPLANAVDKLFGRLVKMRIGGEKNGYSINPRRRIAGITAL